MVTSNGVGAESFTSFIFVRITPPKSKELTFKITENFFTQEINVAFCALKDTFMTNQRVTNPYKQGLLRHACANIYFPISRTQYSACLY